MVQHTYRHWFLIFTVLVSYTATTLSHIFTDQEHVWIEQALAAEPWIDVRQGIVVTHRLDQQVNAAQRIIDRLTGKESRELCRLTRRQLLILERRKDVNVVSMNVHGNDVVLVKFPETISTELLQNILGLRSRSQIHCTVPRNSDDMIFIQPIHVS